MAHQTDNIPWELLSSTLKFIPRSEQQEAQTDLFPCNEEGASKIVDQFVRNFVQTLQDGAKEESAKYPTSYDAPMIDDIVITSDDEKLVRGMIQRCRHEYYRSIPYQKCCSRKKAKDGMCSICPLTSNNQDMSLWLQDNCDRCGCCCQTYRHYETTKLIKILILHNRIDTLLRISAHPKIDLGGRWRWECADGGQPVQGWAELMRCALLSYVCLNVFFLKPETYDTAAREAYIVSEKLRPPIFPALPVRLEESHYYWTKSYQRVLSRCTGRKDDDVHAPPHRLFFGIGPDLYDAEKWRENYSGRTEKYNPFVTRNFSGSYSYSYRPISSDVETVLDYLYLKGLPAELALDVMDRAAYMPQRNLPVADDPLHVDNATELREYLAECWEIMLRCDVVAEANGRQISWANEIAACLEYLWQVEAPEVAQSAWWITDNSYKALDPY
jgi:hypothetical protein